MKNFISIIGQLMYLNEFWLNNFISLVILLIYELNNDIFLLNDYSINNLLLNKTLRFYNFH